MISMSNCNLRLVLLSLSITVLLGGCEALAPEAIKRTPVPANLKIDPINRQSLSQRPTQSEPIKAREQKPPEYFPAKNSLLGNGNNKLGKASPEIAAVRKEGKYTLNFDDADLNEVAKTILDETLKINYIISPKVSGRVTLQTTRALAEEELIPTLETLLRLNGAVLIKDNDMYRIEPEAGGIVGAPGAKIGTPGQRIPPGFQLRIIPLRYVGAQEMQKILEPLMPPKSIIRVDTTRNMLWVAGSSEELATVLDTVQLFDVDFMSGMSVGIYPLTNVEPALIATEIQKIIGDTNKGPLAGLVKILPIDRLNSILAITPQPRYLEEIASWVGRLDRYSPNRMGSIHVYRLQNVDAIELAKTLSNIFGGRSGSGSSASLRPGFQNSNIGASSGSTPGGGGSGFSNSAGDLGSSPSGDLGMGSSSGSMGSSMGPNYGAESATGSGSSGFGGGSTSGYDSSGGSGGSGSSGGFGSSGGGSGSSGGGFGSSGGLGRGTQQNRSSQATNIGNIRIVADPANNALIITAKYQEYQEIETVIKELDILPLQVLIDATIAEVVLTDNLQYGIKWYFNQGNYAGGLGIQSIFGSSSDSLAGAASQAGLTYFMNFGKEVKVLLQAEADKGKVNIVSSPSVMVQNNQEAAMRVGDQVPILTGQYGNFTGGAATTTTNPVYSSYNSVQYRDTGVLLNVRPRVNSGGLVSMDIIQNVSNVNEAKQISGISSPTITQRQIKSNVSVQNGETLVLGGLIQENTGNAKAGIPLLYELPVIGDLFGKTTMTTTRKELVVLLTPRIVDTSSKGR
ncbi:MAG TPA: type II secretion system protein GspD, partial [Methylococcaceae bacterium]|nr:type II secretion system protein GspD [Methylococcaceae bacterium]